jgi:flagellar protein FliS
MPHAKKSSMVNAYAQNKAQGDVTTANPHRLIQMLFEGAIEKIVKAKLYMAEQKIADKGQYISWAISIIDGLKMSLDLESGGEIAKNLDALYDYMENQLVKANAENNPEYLDEVVSLIKSVKSAWDEMPVKYQNARAVTDNATVNITSASV